MTRFRFFPRKRVDFHQLHLEIDETTEQGQEYLEAIQAEALDSLDICFHLLDIKGVRGCIVQLSPGTRLFLSIRRYGLQPSCYTTKATFCGKFQYFTANLVIHCGQAASTCPKAFWAQLSQFIIKIKIILILLRSFYYLRVAENTVVYDEVAFVESGYFSNYLIDRPVPNFGPEDVGHRTKPAVVGTTAGCEC